LDQAAGLIVVEGEDVARIGRNWIMAGDPAG